MRVLYYTSAVILSCVVSATTARAQDYITFTLEAGCAGYATMANERGLADELLSSAIEHGLQAYAVRDASPTFDNPGVADDYGPEVLAGFSVGVAFVATQQEVLNIAYREGEFETIESWQRAKVETARLRFETSRCERFLGRGIGSGSAER